MTGRRHLALATLAATALLGGTAVEASAATYMQSSFKSLRVKPKTVTFGAAGQLRGIRWRGWGGKTASARNVRYTNNGFSGRNTIRVSRRITCQGRRVYSRLRIVGRGSPGALTLSCDQIKDLDLRFRKRR